MQLTAKIVKKDHESYVSKLTGQPVDIYKFYLASGDPMDGAIEATASKEVWETLKQDELYSFVPTFVIGQRYGTPVVKVKIYSDLKPVKA